MSSRNRIEATISIFPAPVQRTGVDVPVNDRAEVTAEMSMSLDDLLERLQERIALMESAGHQHGNRAMYMILVRYKNPPKGEIVSSTNSIWVLPGIVSIEDVNQLICEILDDESVQD